MLTFTSEELRRIMGLRNNIRNMSMIADVGHGKSTLTRYFAVNAGILAQEITGDVGTSDAHQDEGKRGPARSAVNSLYYKMSDESLENFKGKRDGNEYMINLIGSHAFSIIDGALVVVDYAEGVSVETETALKQVLGGRIRPVLTVNKIDRCFLEFQDDGEEAYQTFRKVIEEANAIIAAYEDPLVGDMQVSPEKGTVAFSSGLHGWAFTLANFAKVYASKHGVDESKMMERLWGEQFFDPATKEWTSMLTGSPTCKRGFVQLCYEPIKMFMDSCMAANDDNKNDEMWMLGACKKLKREEDWSGEAFTGRAMGAFFPASNALLEMMILHAPSPPEAQKYRVDKLYEGPLDDIYANAIRDCDPEGPLVLGITKAAPATYLATSLRTGSYFAFGRVFSGKVSRSKKGRRRVVIVGPELKKRNNVYIDSVYRAVFWSGRRPEQVKDVPCGNPFLMIYREAGNNAKIDAHDPTTKTMEPSVSPDADLERNVPSDIPKLVNNLQEDFMGGAQISQEEGEGGLLAEGIGGLHLGHTL